MTLPVRLVRRTLIRRVLVSLSAALVAFAPAPAQQPTTKKPASQPAAPATSSTSPAAAAVARADSGTRLPFDPQAITGTLPNGIKYFVRANKRPEKRAELRLVVNAGSILEDEDQRGIAHFVEHMSFNGTKNFPKADLVNYLESVGMRFGPDLNAYTSFDETVYMLQIPTDTTRILEKGFQILEDWARDVSFDKTEIAKERGVVVEEWRGKRGAGARILDKELPIIFSGSRYAQRLPIGSQESIQGFSDDAVRRFYQDWYRPDLMAVVAVGDFDAAQIERIIKQKFSDIPPAPMSARKRELFPVPGHDSTLVGIVTDPEATNTSVEVLYKQPARRVETVGAYRQDLVEALYNNMLNRRLDEITQKPDAPFIGAGSGQGRFARTSEVYELSAAVKEGGVERGLEALLTEAERVDRHGFTAGELSREKAEMLRGMEQSYAEREKTNSGAFAGAYVDHYLAGSPEPGIAYEYELYRKYLPTIELAEVNRLAREWITDRNRVILVSAPEKAGVTLPSEAQLVSVFGAVKKREVAAYTETLSDAPLLPNVPKAGRVVAERKVPELGVTEWTLSNGARVVLKPTDFKADELLFSASSPGGTSLASEKDYMSAQLAALIYGNVTGVGAFSNVDLQKKLAGKAVGASPQFGALREGLSGRASPKDVETLFQLVHLYFTAPRTDSSAFLAFKQAVQASLANRSASPAAAFQDTLNVTLAQHHYRARPVSAALFDEVDPKRALEFYRDRFADASDFTFFFVGNFSPDSLRPLVQTYLASLPNLKRKEQWKDVGIRPPTGVVERAVKKGQEQKSQTALVFTGAFQDSPTSRIQLAALADLLKIKLREQLREELGGTYSVSVTANSSRVPRPEYSLSVGFGSAPERVEMLVKAVFAQIDSLKRAPPSETDVTKVKEIEIRDRETQSKQNGFWMGQLSSRYEAGEDPRLILNYDKMVQALTPADFQTAAKRYLNTSNYVRVSLFPENYVEKPAEVKTTP